MSGPHGGDPDVYNRGAGEIADYDSQNRGPDARKRAREAALKDPIKQLEARAKEQHRKDAAAAGAAAAASTAKSGADSAKHSAPSRRDEALEKILAAARARDMAASGRAASSTEVGADTGSGQYTGIAGVWNDGKGFGFIKPDEGAVTELFVHMYDVNDGNCLEWGARVRESFREACGIATGSCNVE